MLLCGLYMAENILSTTHTFFHSTLANNNKIIYLLIVRVFHGKMLTGALHITHYKNELITKFTILACKMVQQTMHSKK